MREYVATAKTVEEAIQLGCEALSVDRDDLGVSYEILEMPQKTGFLGLKVTPAKVKVTVETADTQRLKAVLQWISAHYAEGLRVADAAGVCSFSSSHFMRWFKKMTGDSFTSYVNDRRLAEAAEALRQTDDKILTISQDAGFMNLSNFNRQFKKRYGVTPREYREMIGI